MAAKLDYFIFLFIKRSAMNVQYRAILHVAFENGVYVSFEINIFHEFHHIQDFLKTLYFIWNKIVFYRWIGFLYLQPPRFRA